MALPGPDKLSPIFKSNMDASLPIKVASQASVPWLSLIVLLPATGALLMPLLPKEVKSESNLPRNLALGILLADFLYT